MRSFCEIVPCGSKIRIMFRLLLLVYTAAILLSPKALAAEPTRYLCFGRDKDIWIANLNGAGAHKIVAGNDPAISPDGARVAYTSREGEYPAYCGD